MKNLISKWWPAAAGLAFTLFLAFALHLIRVNLSEVADYEARTLLKNEQLVEVEVSEGEPGLDIANELFKKKITASVSSFYQLAINDPRSLQIAPGIHQLNMRISAEQALKQLLDPKRNVGLISIFEGMWRGEIIKEMDSVGFLDLENAFSKLKLPEGYELSDGIFFPAQYSFAKGTSSVKAVQAFVDRFAEEAKKIGLRGKDDLIIASIIQAEGDLGDFEKISRVIYNRLKIGMPLQMDTTVHYATKTRGSVFLSTKSTLIKSPYNTYRRYGLPPGPIGNPGLAAMKAALNPAPGNWLYFITVKPGDTRFTKSHDEFLIWKNEYQKNLQAGVFQ